MYVKIEPSGCCEKKGLIQIRFAMYLDIDDYGYDKHYIQVPIISEKGYEGEIDEFGHSKNIDDYNKWFDGLPKDWQNNPFHNHFIYVEPETTDNEIMNMAEVFLKESYFAWKKNEMPNLKNINANFKRSPTESELSTCNIKVVHLKSIELMRISK